MRWFDRLVGRDIIVKDNIDVEAELSADRIGIAETRAARIKAESEMDNIREKVGKLVTAGDHNHFGESISEGMMLKHRRGV